MLRAKGKKTGSGLQKSGPWSNHKVGHETANWDLVGFFFFFVSVGKVLGPLKGQHLVKAARRVLLPGTYRTESPICIPCTHTGQAL